MSLKCSYLKCRSRNETSEEVVMGLCADCRKLVQDGRNLVALCWNCGAITRIGRKPRFLLRETFATRRPLLIFAKGCRDCLNGNQDLETAWMTIHNEERSLVSVSSTGKLVKEVVSS